MTVKRPMPSHFGAQQPISGLLVATCKPCGFSTGDRALLEAHMASHRNTKTGVAVPLVPEPKYAHKPDWKAPALTEDGKSFEPKELAPGAHVDWMDATGNARSGQVWSVGRRPKSVWVIPFETLPNEAAVLLVQLSNGRLEHQDTVRRSVRQKVAQA